jgi:glycosyltransferase involved in cell wall biosynthesis
VYELSDNLTKLGHTVILFVPKLGYPERQTSSHVVSTPFIDLPVLRFVSFQVVAFLLSLRFMLQKGRPDIIYVRIMWSFIPLLLGKLFSIPVMLEVNDSPHRAYSNIQHSLKRKIVHLIDRISYCLSDHVLPVTLKIAEDLHRIDGLPWNRMTVLPSGTNTDLFRFLDKTSCCKKLKFDPTKKYVGFIGTFLYHQGIDVLIDSAPLIIQQRSDVSFLLVGDGQMRTKWERRVNEMGLKNHFIFTGHVPYKNVPYYCGIMNICVAPFLNEAGECSPVKVFDYLACGKPVVMSDVAETGKIFEDSGAVSLVSCEDEVSLARSILQLLENELLRAEMGEKGRKFVESRYSRMKIAEMVESIAFQLNRKKGVKD